MVKMPGIYVNAAKIVVGELQKEIVRLESVIVEAYNKASTRFTLDEALQTQARVLARIKEIECEIIEVRMMMPPYAEIIDCKVVPVDRSKFIDPPLDPYEKI